MGRRIYTGRWFACPTDTALQVVDLIFLAVAVVWTRKDHSVLVHYVESVAVMEICASILKIHPSANLVFQAEHR